MDGKFLEERTKQNQNRRKSFYEKELATIEEDIFTPVRKIILHQDDGELHYNVYFKEKERSKKLSLNKAMEALPIPILLFLGIDDGNAVNEEMAISFGLLYEGEEESSKHWGILKKADGAEREYWVPTHIRKDKNGVYYARDRRTDGPAEWHNDVLLWSLAGLSEGIWSSCVEQICVWGADSEPAPEILQLRAQMQWLIDIDSWCSQNIGRSYNIEEGVGFREGNRGNPPSGFAEPIRKMDYYFPYHSCLVSAAAALIQVYDETAAKKLKSTPKCFANLGAFQGYLQGVCKTGWTANVVKSVERKTPSEILQYILNLEGSSGDLMLIRLNAWDSLSKHVVGVDFKMGLIWDSCEKFALRLTEQNLEHCCGNRLKLRGVQELRVLRGQQKKRRIRGGGNSKRSKKHRYFKS